jgi:protein subunit release factor A
LQEKKQNEALTVKNSKKATHLRCQMGKNCVPEDPQADENIILEVSRDVSRARTCKKTLELSRN